MSNADTAESKMGASLSSVGLGRAGKSALLLAGALSMCGCIVERAGPTEHEFRTVELDNAESVRVSLKMGAGRLRVSSGTQKLARADFTYNVPSWKPYVRYSSAAGRGDLSIEQPGTSHKHIGNTRYEWDVRLNKDVPMDVRVNFGAGDAELDLGSLSLRSVDVEMGVGKIDLDLRGNPKHDYSVRIRGGIGEATVRLPSDVGVVADAQGGLGEIQASGFHREGHRYTNDSYDRSKVTIRLDVRGGIGAIHLFGV